MFGCDENAKYDNSSDGEEDIGAGAGVGDEVIKLKRYVFATLIFTFSTVDTAVVAGDGNAHGSRAKNDVGL